MSCLSIFAQERKQKVEEERGKRNFKPLVNEILRSKKGINVSKVIPAISLYKNLITAPAEKRIDIGAD